MALESAAIAPPSIGAGNKDTQNDGESDENIQDDSFTAIDPADLEEGEILDSDGEAQENVSHNDGQVVFQVVAPFDPNMKPGNTGKKKRKKKKKKNEDGTENDANDLKQPKKKAKYVDHDRVQDEDMWFAGSPPSNNYRRASMKDYRHNYDSPYNSPQGSSHQDFSPDCNRSESPKSGQSLDENANDFDHEQNNHRPRQGRMVKARRVLGRKQPIERGGTKKRRMVRPSAMAIADGKKKRRPLRLKRREPRQRATCKFYLEGKCLKGNDCPFAHNAAPPKKKDLCKFFLNGYCAKGEKCLYMHGEFPCKYFHTGAKCYSEPNCRFSHEPMSEEMEKVFKRFLEKSQKEEEEMEMMFAEEAMNSPPRHKRPSLLGSPPRHIKEAAETWQWQQQMMQMQRNKRGPPINGGQQRGPFARPNFYVDTMSHSPVKHTSYNHNHQEFDSPNYDSYNGPSDSPARDCQTPIPTDEDEDNNFSVDERKDGDFESMLWDEAGSGTHSAESPPRELSPARDPSDSEVKQEPLSPPPIESQAPLSPPAPPAAIPIHLPRRQRELFLRIQQHQKEVSASGESSEEQEGKLEDIPEEETIEKEEIADQETETNDLEEEEKEEIKEKWYSSDEDESEDQPLAEVLKKLQQMPLPPRTQPPPVTAVPVVAQPIDISKMLNNIRQQANQQVFSMQSEFWQNILSTAAPLALPKPAELPTRSQQTLSSRDPRCRDAKQPLLATPTTPAEPPASSRDPRTSRDPRNLNRVQPRPAEVKPVVETTEEEKMWEVRIPGRTTDGKTNCTSLRLHTVSVLPRDYMPYVHATQNDLKLLADPRLKKLLAQLPIPTTPILPFPPDLKQHLEKVKEPETLRLPLPDPIIQVRKPDPRLVRGATSSTLTSSSNEPLPVAAALLNPGPAISHFPRSSIDPRLARLHHPPDIRRLPQKRPVKPKQQVAKVALAAKNRTDKLPTFKQPAPPPKKEDATVSEKEAIGGSINRKSILDYASPLGSYDEGSSNGSGYSSYNRRPQQRAPPPADNPTTTGGATNTTTSTAIVTSSVQGTSQSNIPRQDLPSSETLTTPESGFNPCSPDEDLSTQVPINIKDVFKTIDPTASPFC